MSKKENIFPIIGNHEHELLTYARSVLASRELDEDGALARLREYFPDDGELLLWEDIDYLESLPYYAEGK